MTKRIAGDTHELCLLPSEHIYQQEDGCLAVSSFPLSQEEMDELCLLPTLIYCLSTGEHPPSLPCISYCLIASAAVPIMPTEAVFLFWSNAALLFGVPNRLVVNQDIVRNHPSLLEFCTDEGVLVEVDMRPPTSVMRKRLQWISFRLVERWFDKQQGSDNETLDIFHCNERLLHTASSFQHRERFPLRAVLPLDEKDSTLIRDYILAAQNAFPPSSIPAIPKQEPFPLLMMRNEHKTEGRENLVISNSRVLEDNLQKGTLRDIRSNTEAKQLQEV